MIFLFLIKVILGLITGVFYILPSLPAMPSAVVTAGDWTATQITGAISILNMIYGTTLLAGMMVIIIAMFSFELIYRSSMFVLHKVPFINVH
jgi:hypothetical protein